MGIKSCIIEASYGAPVRGLRWRRAYSHGDWVPLARAPAMAEILFGASKFAPSTPAWRLVCVAAECVSAALFYSPATAPSRTYQRARAANAMPMEAGTLQFLFFSTRNKAKQISKSDRESLSRGTIEQASSSRPLICGASTGASSETSCRLLPRASSCHLCGQKIIIRYT